MKCLPDWEPFKIHEFDLSFLRTLYRLPPKLSLTGGKLIQIGKLISKILSKVPNQVEI